MGTEPAMMRSICSSSASPRLQLGSREAVFDVIRVPCAHDGDVHGRVSQRPRHSELGDRAAQLLGGESLQLIDDLEGSG